MEAPIDKDLTEIWQVCHMPSVVFNTCVCTGLVGLELYKAIQGKELEGYRNTFVNLALPLFAMAEPLPPKKFSHESLEWSIWDRWILEGDLTVRQVLDWFKVSHPFCTLSFVPAILFASFQSPLSVSLIAGITGGMQIPDQQ